MPKEVKTEGENISKLIKEKDDEEIKRLLHTRKWEQWFLIMSCILEGKDNVLAIKYLLKMLDTFTNSIFT